MRDFATNHGRKQTLCWQVISLIALQIVHNRKACNKKLTSWWGQAKRCVVQLGYHVFTSEASISVSAMSVKLMRRCARTDRRTGTPQTTKYANDGGIKCKRYSSVLPKSYLEDRPNAILRYY